MTNITFFPWQDLNPGQVGFRVYTCNLVLCSFPCKVLTQTLYGCVGVSSLLGASGPGEKRRAVKKKLADHKGRVQVNQLFLKC